MQVFSALLNFLQYLHPSKALGYYETARALRAVGRECVWKRINAIENGEQVPNDILTHILKIRSRSTSFWCLQLLIEVVFFAYVAKEEAVDIEVLVDDFVTFYVANRGNR